MVNQRGVKEPPPVLECDLGIPRRVLQEVAGDREVMLGEGVRLFELERQQLIEKRPTALPFGQGRTALRAATHRCPAAARGLFRTSDVVF